MLYKRLKIEVVEGTAEDLSFTGKRGRRKTVLLRVGRHSISRRAFEWGVFLAVFQILDATLTYIGVRLMGIRMEANTFISQLMHAYGVAHTLFMVKTAAIIMVLALTAYAHSRRWLRWFMMLVCVIYLCAAVVPWVYIISRFHASGN